MYVNTQNIYSYMNSYLNKHNMEIRVFQIRTTTKISTLAQRQR